MAKKSFLEKISDEDESMDETDASETTRMKVRNETPLADDREAEEEGQLTLDVFQTPSEVIIKSTIAGVRDEDLDVSINNDMVTIRGKREKEHEVAQKDYYYQELYWGSFSRSVILPVEVDADEAAASVKNGILTIRIPKAEREKHRKIKVKRDDK